MEKTKVSDEVLHETLTQVSMELESSARAAKQAAECVSDKRALWTSIQSMYARLNQASYLVARLKILAEERAKRDGADDGPGDP
jgi:hypothetical protein